jgi:hypothetical protein
MPPATQPNLTAGSRRQHERPLSRRFECRRHAGLRGQLMRQPLLRGSRVETGPEERANARKASFG